MPEHSNAAVVRRGYEAFAEGDAETLAALIAEDAVWHVGGRNLFSDTYQGREAIFTYFRKLREFTNDSLAIELHAVLADDEHAVALVHMTGRRARRELAMNAATTYHMCDGQVVRLGPSTRISTPRTTSSRTASTARGGCRSRRCARAWTVWSDRLRVRELAGYRREGCRAACERSRS